MSSEIQFEKALERLEKIVEDLEAGQVTLEEALKRYEEGVKLARACQEKLSQAEKKIEILTKSKDGSFKKENFLETNEASGDQKAKKSSRGIKPRATEEDEDKDLLL